MSRSIKEIDLSGDKNAQKNYSQSFSVTPNYQVVFPHKSICCG